MAPASCSGWGVRVPEALGQGSAVPRVAEVGGPLYSPPSHCGGRSPCPFQRAPSSVLRGAPCAPPSPCRSLNVWGEGWCGRCWPLFHCPLFILLCGQYLTPWPVSVGAPWQRLGRWGVFGTATHAWLPRPAWDVPSLSGHHTPGARKLKPRACWVRPSLPPGPRAGPQVS